MVPGLLAQGGDDGPVQADPPERSSAQFPYYLFWPSLGQIKYGSRTGQQGPTPCAQDEPLAKVSCAYPSEGRAMSQARNPYGDGQAASRIVQVLTQTFAAGPRTCRTSNPGSRGLATESFRNNSTSVEQHSPAFLPGSTSIPSVPKSGHAPGLPRQAPPPSPHTCRIYSPRPLLDMDFASIRLFCLLAVRIRQVMTLFHTSFSPRLTTTPLRFANPSPPSGWVEDPNLQAEANQYRGFTFTI